MLSDILKQKIKQSMETIKCWNEAWEGMTYCSFSGGKDSIVLLHLIRNVSPKTIAVFVNTGLEFPENIDIVKEQTNIKIIKPSKNFKTIITEFGYPIISKEISKKINFLKTIDYKKYKKTYDYYMTGYTSTGKYSQLAKLPKKWRFLIDAPFKISDQCCTFLKKDPFLLFEKETGLHPFIGIKKADSFKRKIFFSKHECNKYDCKRPISNPLLFWTDEDVWNYINYYNLNYSKIYNYDFYQTGCIFCMFGIHIEQQKTGTNRFIKLKKVHPKLWNYCINKLEIGNVLEYLKIPKE